MNLRNFQILLISLSFGLATKGQKTDIKEIILSKELPTPTSITFLSDDTIFFESYGKIYLSFDNGENWKQYENNPSSHDYIVYSPSSWIRTHEQELHNYHITNDTGKTYTKVKPPFEVYHNTINLYDDIWFAKNITKKGKYELLSSKDLGTSWQIAHDSFLGSPIIRNDSTILFGGMFNQKDKNKFNVFTSNNFGKNLEGHASITNENPSRFVSIDTCYFLDYNYDDNTITIEWSYDGGSNIYTQYTTNFSSSDDWGRIAMANSKIGYRLEAGTKLYKTYDGGQNWAHKYTFACPVAHIEIIDKDHVYFHFIGGSQAVNKCIYVTHNGAEPIVGEEEQPRSQNFKLYPNPATQSITLNTPNSQNAALSIYNLMGQLQYSNANQAPGNIDISQLATGLYIFELRQGSVVQRQ
ncbi:MAG: T9SS type A sorting domain-containing protein, partial [Bacteroidia bacterium]